MKWLKQGFQLWRARRRAKKRLRELGIEEAKMRKYRKAIVAIVGVVLMGVSRFVPALEDADAAGLVDAIIAAGTALGVWGVPNDDK